MMAESLDAVSFDLQDIARPICIHVNEWMSLEAAYRLRDDLSAAINAVEADRLKNRRL